MLRELRDRKIIFLILVVLWVFSGLEAVANDAVVSEDAVANKGAGADAGIKIQITDQLGFELTLDQPATKIVSLAPHITESLFAVGAGDRIVATVNYSNYPEQALSIPVIGGYDKVNVEAVVAMQPDLVIAWANGNGLATIQRLRELGLSVYVTEPKRLVDIAQSLLDMGLLSGQREQGKQAADDFSRRLTALRKQYGRQRKVEIFYQVWNEPLMSINAEHMISDVITLCGGQNVFAEAGLLYPVLSVESVIRANPEVIVASGMGEERPDWVNSWRQWPSLQASKNSHLYYIPPSLLQRHSTRILDGAEMLCQNLEKARLSKQVTRQQTDKQQVTGQKASVQAAAQKSTTQKFTTMP